MPARKSFSMFGSYVCLGVCFLVCCAGVGFFIIIGYHPFIMAVVFEGSFVVAAAVVLGRRHVAVVPQDIVGEKAVIVSRGKDRVLSALEESKRLAVESKSLLAGSRVLRENKDFESTARAIFDICKNTVGATAGYVALVSADGSENEVLFLDSGGRACDVNPDLPMPIRGLRAKAYASNAAVYENDFGNSEWSHFIPSKHVGLDNVLFAPLVVEGKAVGVMGLANKNGGFNDNDARLATAFGEIASVALERCRMVESLQVSERRFLGLYESDMMGIAFCRESGEVVDANDAFLRMTGYIRGDLERGAVNWVNMTPPEQVKLTRKGIVEAKSRGYFAPFEKEYIRKDGSSVSVLMGGAILEGKQGLGVAYAIDLTDYRRMEGEVTLERRKLELLAEAMGGGVTVRDTDYRLTYQNEHNKAVFGDRLGEKCYEVFQGRDSICEGCPVEMAINDGKCHTALREVVLPSGEKGYWENTAVPVRDGKGRIISCLEVNRDVTERMRAERALAESEGRLRAAIDAMPFDFWIRDLEGRCIMENASLIKSWGDCAGRLPEEQGVPAETLAMWKSNNARALAGETVRGEVEYEVGGKRRVLHNVVAPVKVGEEIVGILGINIDVTEQKRVEEALREKKDRLRVLFETIRHAVYECDAKGVITVANGAYSRITGYSREEIVGMHVWEMMEDGEQKDSLRDYVCQLAREQPAPSTYSCRNVTKDGRLIDVEVDWDYKRDAKGKVTGFVCVLSEVTARVRAQEEKTRLLKAIEAAREGMSIVSPQGVITYTNRAMEQLFGYGRGELVGRKVEILNGGPHPEAKTEEVVEFLETSSNWEGELCSLRKDGSEFLSHASVHVTRDESGDAMYYVTTQHDITNQKDFERKIERLAKFPAENPDPVIRVMGDGTVVYGNRSSLPLLKAWGCREGEHLEGQWYKMVCKALNFGYIQREEVAYEGHTFSLVFAPVVEADYVNIYGHDITDLREAESSLYWESSVNKALSQLSNILNKPYYSFEEISDLVLAHAKRMTKSESGFVGYIDEATGYLVCPTMTKQVWKQCQVPGKDIVFKELKGLLSCVLSEKKSLLTNSPGTDERAVGIPEGHIAVNRFVASPALTGDEVVGMVALANSEREYVERDVWLLERLAEIYALAVGSRRSHRRLAENERQLRSIVSNVSLSEERRRRRMALEMCEYMMRPLCVVENRIALLAEGGAADAGPMPQVREAISELLERTRDFVNELSFPVLGRLRLPAAVERWLSEEVGKRRGIVTVFEGECDWDVEDEDLKHFLFESVRRLLMNTIEHSRASRVKVSLVRNADGIEVVLADDGIGFETGRGGWASGEIADWGMLSIWERLRHMGGDMVVESRPGMGTKVTLRAPSEAPAEN